MYQIYWKDQNGLKQSMNINCTEKEKDDIMDSLKPFEPQCFERLSPNEKKTVQVIKKDHKPVQRGARYLTCQASFGLKPQGETLYTYMIPDLGYEKISEYMDHYWKSERDNKPVEVVGLVWRTLNEIKYLCQQLRIKKLVWLEIDSKKEKEEQDKLEAELNGIAIGSMNG